MTTLPALEPVYTQTVGKDSDGSGGVAVFALYDKANRDRFYTMGVPRGRADVVSEIVRRSNDYPHLISLIGRMALELEFGGNSPKSRACLVQEARDAIGSR